MELQTANLDTKVVGLSWGLAAVGEASRGSRRAAVAWPEAAAAKEQEGHTAPVVENTVAEAEAGGAAHMVWVARLVKLPVV